MAALFLLLPSFYHAHREYLLWAEGFMERALATGFLSGRSAQLTETPKPLWNLFWLLATTPNQLYLVIAIMVGVAFYLFLDVSRRLTGSIGFGIAASLITVFALKDVLDLFLGGNWALPIMILGLLFLTALLTRRWTVAAIAVGLAGLIRPECWALAVYLPVYVTSRQEKLKWHYFLPLLAPVLWALYDHRLSGDWLFSYRTTAAYAFLTGVPGVNFLTFWPRLLPDILESTGIVVPLLALLAMILRAVNLTRGEFVIRTSSFVLPRPGRRPQRIRAILLDPLFAVTWLPLLASWLASVRGDIAVMRRFYYLSIGLWTLYALLLPFEYVRFRKVGNRRLVIGVTCALILLVAAVRAPAIVHDSYTTTRVTEAKMAAIVGLTEEVNRPLEDLNNYKTVIVPFRRLALFRALLNDEAVAKLISYRELSVAVTSAQLAQTDQPAQAPAGSPPRVRELVESRKRFADFLPALALWIPDDEAHYLDLFSFDDPQYFRHNYIDHGHYAFRIIGAALDSLGLIYEVRELGPGEIRPVPPPESTATGEQ